MTVPAKYERGSAQFYAYLVDARDTATNGRGWRAMPTRDSRPTRGPGIDRPLHLSIRDR